MSNEVTQDDADKAIYEFKEEILKIANGQKFEMAMMLNRDVMSNVTMYELEVKPHIESLGLVAPSISELFGVSVEITEKDSE